MPQIIVTADRSDGHGGLATLLRRLGLTDVESQRCIAGLVDRLGETVEDDHAVERGRERVAAQAHTS